MKIANIKGILLSRENYTQKKVDPKTKTEIETYVERVEIYCDYDVTNSVAGKYITGSFNKNLLDLERFDEVLVTLEDVKSYDSTSKTWGIKWRVIDIEKARI